MKLRQRGLDQLERLAAMYREGLLTDAEFQRAKDTLPGS
ncbi:SHOCT domain-containing protein [Nocardia yunnanensis]